MDSQAYLDKCRARAEAVLREALPEDGRRPARLTEAIRYSVLVGGKRVRPMLCLAAAEAVGGAWRDAAPAAVAIELLHTYTLVHDDLPCMDNDLLRRGQPTVHAKYGEALGVLAGDALQACAFAALACNPSTDPARVVRWVRELSDAAGPYGVVGGQVEDVVFSGGADEATIAFVHQHKTADLFRAAMRLGAIGGGGDEGQIDALGTFGNHLGLAFQVVDDLLDAPAGDDDDAPTASETGEERELSCLMVWSAAEARRQAKLQTTAAVAALEGWHGDAAEALRRMAASLLERIV